MNEEEIRQIALLSKELDSEKLRRMNIENEYNQNQLGGFKDNQNVIEFQLNLKEELDRIYHLLLGDILVRDGEGNETWQSPEDDRLRIFSQYGVKQIMNIIHFYINKNTLLSNFEEDTILWKVRDFGIELSDLIFNRYEAFFYYPTPEQLFDYYKPICKRNNINITDEELYYKCIMWSKEELQSKLRHYPIIVMSLVDSVHSTYLRALKGEERTSLRKQMNIHQSLVNSYPYEENQQNKPSLFRPSTWGR